jgi:cyclophilin family peptidyl-prolyl cis-trans isomerase
MGLFILYIGTANAESEKSPALNSVMVEMETNLGSVTLLLDLKNAPITVNNFLRYVDEGYYNGSIFHRVIPKFMIQGGGFNAEMQKLQTHDPIKNEATNGLQNLSGTIAMARTNVVDSATAQFFINTVDNAFLDHRPANFGYAVFGKVIQGMSVVKAIEATPTANRKGMANVPTETVSIISMKRVE